MPLIEICHSPELLHLYSLENKNVVVTDILRATSCMVTGLACGVNSFKLFSNLEECRAMKNNGFLIAAEREGKKVDGFDFGNSPLSYMTEDVAGKDIAFTTTNGTRAVQKSSSGNVIIGSFLNLKAVTEYLETSEDDVVVVCAGWKGRFSLEDTLFGGALVELLSHHSTNDDAAIAARYLYSLAKDNLFEFLSNSSHFHRLAKLNIEKDIEFCLTLDQYSNLPLYKNEIIVNS